MLLNEMLLLGAVLFCIGVYGVLARRNGVLVLMSIELISQRGEHQPDRLRGLPRHGSGPDLFALFVITVGRRRGGHRPGHRVACCTGTADPSTWTKSI